MFYHKLKNNQNKIQDALHPFDITLSKQKKQSNDCFFNLRLRRLQLLFVCLSSQLLLFSYNNRQQLP